MMKFKNFCGVFATVFVTTTIILLASCSQDDDYYESDMYTLAEMGTRLGGDSEIFDDGYNQNAYIPGEVDCCGLYTLTARSVEMYGRDAFVNGGPHEALKAKDLYIKMKNYAMSHAELHWTPDSPAMPLSTIMHLSQVFKVYGKPLFSEVKCFNTLEEVQEYLSVAANRNKVKAVLLKELRHDGKEHIAHVSVSKKCFNFDGYNYVNDNYEGGTLYFQSDLDKDGNPKKGTDCNNQPYKIIGVLLK